MNLGQIRFKAITNQAYKICIKICIKQMKAAKMQIQKGCKGQIKISLGQSKMRIINCKSSLSLPSFGL